MDRCCICDRPAHTLTLCGPCAQKARTAPDMIPEQIRMAEGGGLDACLIDCWGRIHRLDERTEIGRDPIAFGMAIHQGSISRKHAVMWRDGDGPFMVKDLKSTNGTVVSNRSLKGAVELKSGDLIVFGTVSFYFVQPIPPMPRSNLESSTLSHPSVAETPVRPFRMETDDELSGEELPREVFQVWEATGGGGGFAEVGGKRVQLSVVQLELLEFLIQRMQTDAGRPWAIRGYVHSSEILGAISWDSPNPKDNNVKQLVRRLRRSLAKTGIDDLIESKQGLGYRLSVIPE